MDAPVPTPLRHYIAGFIHDDWSRPSLVAILIGLGIGLGLSLIGLGLGLCGASTAKAGFIQLFPWDEPESGTVASGLGAADSRLG